jgi:phage-related protein
VTDFLPPVVLKLDADISEYVRKLAEADAALKAFGRNANDEVGRLGSKMDHDAARAGEKAGQSLAAGLGSGFTSGMKGLVGTFKIAGLANLIGGAPQLIGALAPIAGLSGLIPGGITSLATSIAALVVGFHGVKDALANSGDVAKYAQALAKLAPAARDTVKALVAMKPALHDIRAATQQSLFAGLAPMLRDLGGNLLPVVKTGLVGVAGGFNDMFRNILQVVNTDGALSSIAVIMGNVAAAVHKSAGSFQGFITGFLDLARVGSTFLPQLGQGMTNMGDKFAQFTARITSDGSFQKFIQGGLDAFKSMLPLLGDLGSIVSSLVRAMSGLGPGLGPIGVLIHQLATFFDSAQGMTALTAIMTTLSQVASLAGGVIMAILPPLAQVLVVLSTALGPIIDILSTQLLPIISQLLGTLGQALVPIIVALGASFAQLLIHLMPFVQALVTNLSPVLLALAPVLAQLATSLGDVLVQSLDALLPAFVQLLPVIAQLAVEVLPDLIPLIRILADMLIIVAPIIKVVATLLAEILGPALRVLAPLLGALVGPLTWIADHMDHAVKVAMKFADQIIKTLTSVQMWRSVGKWFVDLWHTIVAAFDFGVKWVEALPGRVWRALQALPGLLRRAALAAVDAFFVTIGRLIGSEIRDLMEFPHRVAAIFHFLVDVVKKGWALSVAEFHAAVHKITELVRGLWHQSTQETSDGYHAVLKFFNDLPGKAWKALVDLKNKAVGFFKDAKKWLSDAGKDMITGFLDGAKSLVTWAVDGVKRIVGDIVKGVKESLGIHSPSTVFADMGKQTILGFIQGIQDNVGSLRSSILRVVGWRPEMSGNAGSILGGVAGVAAGYVPINVQLGGTQMAAVHGALIPVAQRYKQRTGTTGMI